MGRGFFISELKMAHFGAFWLLFFQLSCVFYFTCKKSGIIGLRKLVAVKPKPELGARGHGLGLGHQAIGLVGCDLDSVWPKLAKGLNRRCDLNYIPTSSN